MLETTFYIDDVNDYETIKSACISLGDKCSEYNHETMSFTITTANANSLLWIGRMSIVKKIKTW